VNPKEFSDYIKQGDFKRVYLFYGEERYLVRYYTDTLVASIGDVVNFDASSPVGSIITASDTMPFLVDKRLVRVQYSNLFVTGRKADSEAMALYLPNIPDSTILVFMESNVDRRGKLYKRISEIGRVIECETPSIQSLTTWLNRLFGKHNMRIDHMAINLLLKYTAHNMTTIAQEADKLVAYVGQSTTVTADDIKAVCSPTLQTRVFDLIGVMGNGHVGQAVNMYRDMILMKEQPLMILAMIIRQFRILLMVKAAIEKGMPKHQMTKAFGLKSFIIDEAESQCRRFTIKKIIGALEECQDTDIKIKTGSINAEAGVELLILQFSV